MSFTSLSIDNSSSFIHVSAVWRTDRSPVYKEYGLRNSEFGEAVGYTGLAVSEPPNPLHIHISPDTDIAKDFRSGICKYNWAFAFMLISVQQDHSIHHPSTVVTMNKTDGPRWLNYLLLLPLSLQHSCDMNSYYVCNIFTRGSTWHARAANVGGWCTIARDENVTMRGSEALLSVVHICSVHSTG